MKLPGLHWNRCIGLFSALLVFSFVMLAQVSAQNLQRTLELRDGTVLQVRIADQNIPWRNVAGDGTVTEMPIELSKVERLVFSESPATERVARVRRLLNSLGAASFEKREQAQAELTMNGGMFREILRQYTTDDSEIKYRLQEILKEIQNESAVAVENQFDIVTLAGENATRDGDVGDWQLQVEHAGIEFSIDRKSIMELHTRVPELDFGDDLATDQFNRETKRETEPPHEKDAPVPPDYIRLDFESTPDGTNVNKGQKIDMLYVREGAKFRSETKGSVVQVFRYNCGSYSQRHCAASSKPAYSGVMEIQFCIPNKPNFPAGVQYVGFFTSSVKPNGTMLEAYNGLGRLISSIKTSKSGSDFLAIRSGEPIAKIRIVPVVEIDADFAIDDFYFSQPHPLIESGDPEMVTVVLKNGDRVQGEQLTFEGDSLRLEKLTYTDHAVRLKTDELAVLIPRRSGDKDSSATPDESIVGYVQSIDGNVLRVAIQNGKFRDVRTGQPIDTNKIAAYWSKSSGHKPLPAGSDVPKGGASIIAGAEAIPLNEVTLGENWIESPGLNARPDLKFSYVDSPVIHFRQPTDEPGLSGVVRTTTAEIIWFGEGRDLELESLTKDGLSLSSNGSSLKISLDEIASLRFPR